MNEEIKKKFDLARKTFIERGDIKEGSSLLKKINTLVNELGEDFNALNGGDLSELQMKLAGYKFYLADYIADLTNKSEFLKAWLKDQRAIQWPEIIEMIKETEGKVKNKEQIENVLQINLRAEITEQLFYEAEAQRYKLKSFAVDDILTALVQRIAELKRQIGQSKQI